MSNDWHLNIVIVVITILFAHAFVQSENVEEKSFATSVAGLEQLLLTEQILIENVDNYADRLQAKVNSLKNLVQQLKVENEKGLQNTEKYLHNPLNGYSLIRRMHNDWTHIEMYMTRPVGEDHINVIRKYRPEMPTSTDITEASEAVYRLQWTYDMEIKDVVSGILNGKQYDAKLNSIDSYFMGLHMYGKKIYHLAVEWFKNALETYADSEFNDIINYNLPNVYSMYAESLTQVYNFKEAASAMEKACKLFPEDAELLSRKNDIEMRAKLYNGPPIIHTKPEPTDHEKGCRGQFGNRPSRLYCIYNTTTSAFLRLAPLKMEIVNMDPYMVIYHDVMSDKEIDELQNLAKPKLHRARVYNHDDGKAIAIQRRTSKFSWFKDNFSNTTMRINQRIRDMTGFDISGSELLQVANYGLGGHYDGHYDFFNVSDSTEVVRLHGDRIATVLFYMSNVEQGGATVFPELKTAVFPRKGTAVMWYNLNNNVECDFRTFHAACPVIVGSKWVCNKWIRSKAQIFTKPCYKY
ncbi:prolyl 4-hydroxylase subunit alpha-2-like [Musca vetustissima]|uniref:prolyl 4-hydroxylase subunit alpha-2-like n=1 Tax=Musca vetustissima TaxID=27455 RepID=UPI002AB7BCBC|nr:prolyl 4-hydroxylase subunit alpha-2-like [Musca vetustissima]